MSTVTVTLKCRSTSTTKKPHTTGAVRGGPISRRWFSDLSYGT